MYSLKMHLVKTRRSTGASANQLFSKSMEFSDQLKFVFGHQYDNVNPSTIDLKAKQNLMLHPEAIILNQETLRQQCLVDLMAVVETLGATSSEERINLDRVGLSTVSFKLGSLDYANAEKLYKELFVSSNNEDVHSVKYVEWTLHLLHGK